MSRQTGSVHALELTGDRFQRWVVLGKSGRKCKNGGIYWLCRCDCGTEREVLAAGLLNGRSTSCGCRKIEVISTHRMTRTATYQAWRSMLNRCFNKKTEQYANYGGRGVTVCGRWMNFDNFFEDMGLKPEGRSLDRYPDYNGDYYPENCRWATQTQQIRNKRNTARVIYEGQEIALSELCEQKGLKLRRIRQRLAAGMSVEEAVQPGKKNRWDKR